MIYIICIAIPTVIKLDKLLKICIRTANRLRKKLNQYPPMRRRSIKMFAIPYILTDINIIIIIIVLLSGVIKLVLRIKRLWL